MALAKFRKIVGGAKKKATKDLSTSSKKSDKDKKTNQSSAGLAQLVEHFTCNEDVAGSNPAWGSRGLEKQKLIRLIT